MSDEQTGHICDRRNTLLSFIFLLERAASRRHSKVNSSIPVVWNMELTIPIRGLGMCNLEFVATNHGYGIGIWNLQTQRWNWEWNWNTENSIWIWIPNPEYRVDFPLWLLLSDCRTGAVVIDRWKGVRRVCGIAWKDPYMLFIDSFITTCCFTRKNDILDGKRNCTCRVLVVASFSEAPNCWENHFSQNTFSDWILLKQRSGI